MNDLSDAGGVAARLGFKYQDHVAASFVLDMIGDPNVLQVECEIAIQSGRHKKLQIEQTRKQKALLSKSRYWPISIRAMHASEL